MLSNTKNATPEENALLSLFHGKPLAPAISSSDRNELVSLAVRHRVLAPLTARILSEDGVGASWRDWALPVSLSSARDERLIAKAMAKVILLLEKAGITPIVLKGPSLAIGRPRDSGDVDLLIRAGDLLASIETLEAAGYAYRGFDRNMFIRRGEYRDWEKLSRWSNQFEFAGPVTGALIELHTAFFETSRVYAEDLKPLKERTEGFISRAVVDPATGYRYLALEDRALLLALHAGLKRAPDRSSFVLRHLLDLDVLIEAGLDWKKLLDRALSCGAVFHLAVLLRLYRAFGGTHADEVPVAEIEAALSKRERTLVGLKLRCLKGLRSYDRVSIFLYRLVSPFILKGTLRARLRSLFVFPLFFPAAYRLEKIYRLPPRSRATYFFYLLEPLRWLYKAIRKLARATVAR